MKETLLRFERHVAERPDCLALEEGDLSWSFSDLDFASTNLALKLEAAGASGNDVITWIGGAGAYRAIVFLATQKAGLTFSCPILQMGCNYVRDFLALVGPSVVVCDPGFEDYVAHTDLPIMIFEDDRTPRQPLSREIDDAWISHLSFTSGSTGTPKGMARNRAAMEYLTGQAIDMLRLRPKEPYGLLGNLWHPTLLAGMIAGAKTICFDTSQHGAAKLVDWMKARRISAIMTYPAIFREIAADGRSLPDLRETLLIGEPLSRRDAEAHARLVSPHGRLMNVYGSMEFAYVTRFVRSAGDPINFDMMPLGLAVDDGVLELVDETGAPVPLGAVGEIKIISDHVVLGYLGDPSLSEGKFGYYPDGRKFQLTGDLAYQDYRGVYHSVGRRDGQTKVRGFNVHPAEVEAIISDMPGVEEVAVAIRDGPVGIARLACYLVGHADPNDLRKQLKARLPNYMVPSVWTCLSELPRTPSGKIKRSDLPDPFSAGPSVSISRFGDDAEVRIADIFQEILGVDGFGPHDDFFDLGGDSLQAMRLLLQLETVFGDRLPFESFVLDGGSVADIAETMRTMDSGLAKVLRQGRDAPTLALMPGYNGYATAFLPMTERLDTSLRVISGNCDIGSIRSIRGMAEEIFRQMRNEMDGDREVVLIGYSLGGAVAAEVAAKAQKAGVRTPSLVLIDPRVKWRGVRDSFMAAFHYFRSSNRQEAFDELAKLMRTYGLLPPVSETERRNAMLNRYRPGRIEARRCLFIASSESGAKANAEAWSQCIQGPFETHVAPAGHLELVREPHINLITQKIQAWISGA